MKKNTPTQELINALHETLAKNSDRLTTEEVDNLKATVDCLYRIQLLEKKSNEDPEEKRNVQYFINIELVKIAGYILRSLLDADIIKKISDLLN